jgi:hypothetical protein
MACPLLADACAALHAWNTGNELIHAPNFDDADPVGKDLNELPAALRAIERAFLDPSASTHGTANRLALVEFASALRYATRD